MLETVLKEQMGIGDRPWRGRRAGSKRPAQQDMSIMLEEEFPSVERHPWDTEGMVI